MPDRSSIDWKRSQPIPAHRRRTRNFADMRLTDTCARGEYRVIFQKSGPYSPLPSDRPSQDDNLSDARTSVCVDDRPPSPPSLAPAPAAVKRALARALARSGTRHGRGILALLDAAAAGDQRAHVAGLTGPPGVGKSTLTNALIRDWRFAWPRLSASSPSIHRRGGDRRHARRPRADATDPDDKERLCAPDGGARDRLGGLSRRYGGRSRA